MGSTMFLPRATTAPDSAVVENAAQNRNVRAPEMATSPHPPVSRSVAAFDNLFDLIDSVVAIDRELNSLSARRAQLIDAAREYARESVGDWRGSATLSDKAFAQRVMVSELGCALRVPESSTEILVEESHRLVSEHPATMVALGKGDLTYRHAQSILEHTSGLDAADCQALEERLATRAKTTTVAQLNRIGRRERERLHPRPLVERHEAVLPKRCVELDPTRDGMAWLHQYLPAVHATAIFNRLSDISASLRGPSEPRTLPQLRADVFTELLLDDGARQAIQQPAWSSEVEPASCAVAGATGGGSTASEGTMLGLPASPDRQETTTSMGPSLRGIRPTVAVTVPVMTLLGRSEEPGNLEGYGPIDADTARQLAAQAPSFMRVLTHPETGAVLSVGRQRYSVPSDLKSWLRLRDETCRFPGCSRRAQRCDIDHITAWQDGGETRHDNLIHLCRHHHRLKHTSRWSVRALNAGNARQRVSPEEQVTADSQRQDGFVARADTRADARADTRAPSGIIAHSCAAHSDAARSDAAWSDAARSDAVLWTAPSGRWYISEPALSMYGGDASGLLTAHTPDDASTASATNDRAAIADASALLRFPELPPF
jgi:Domain of unknown function (DUF222)/HNH endonuclease